MLPVGAATKSVSLATLQCGNGPFSPWSYSGEGGKLSMYFFCPEGAAVERGLRKKGKHIRHAQQDHPADYLYERRLALFFRNGGQNFGVAIFYRPVWPRLRLKLRLPGARRDSLRRLERKMCQCGKMLLNKQEEYTGLLPLEIYRSREAAEDQMSDPGRSEGAGDTKRHKSDIEENDDEALAVYKYDNDEEEEMEDFKLTPLPIEVVPVETIVARDAVASRLMRTHELLSAVLEAAKAVNFAEFSNLKQRRNKLKKGVGSLPRNVATLHMHDPIRVLSTTQRLPSQTPLVDTMRFSAPTPRSQKDKRNRAVALFWAPLLLLMVALALFRVFVWNEEMDRIANRCTRRGTRTAPGEPGFSGVGDTGLVSWVMGSEGLGCRTFISSFVTSRRTTTPQQSNFTITLGDWKAAIALGRVASKEAPVQEDGVLPVKPRWAQGPLLPNATVSCMRTFDARGLSGEKFMLSSTNTPTSCSDEAVILHLDKRTQKPSTP
ncbi:hypothetical protein DFJ73DRAFT_956522 [Zopfochytrium polystomum]|nr:hypothetical protein DFJ73DRAFT_956522 [Zopfochytrium polystomum]